MAETNEVVVVVVVVPLCNIWLMGSSFGSVGLRDIIINSCTTESILQSRSVKDL